jgi:hypothetical protein
VKKEDYNPSATIQLDVRDLQLQDPSAPDVNEQARRTAPPPLPPSAFAPPAPVVAPVAPRARSNKPLVYGAVFVVLLAAAIFGGVKVGFALRAPAPRASASSAPPPPAASAEGAIISIPTVEFTDTPDAH